MGGICVHMGSNWCGQWLFSKFSKTVILLAKRKCDSEKDGLRRQIPLGHFRSEIDHKPVILHLRMHTSIHKVILDGNTLIYGPWPYPSQILKWEFGQKWTRFYSIELYPGSPRHSKYRCVLRLPPSSSRALIGDSSSGIYMLPDWISTAWLVCCWCTW